MLGFKEFLNEYLLFDQEKNLKAAVEKAYPKHDNYMTPKAREATDNFFGNGNDLVKEPLINFDHDKSEVHQAVEKHLKKPLTHEEYIKGTTSDQHGRQVRLGKLITDPQLRNDFASDNTRAGTKKNQQHYVSVVRGLESGGQTNSQPNAEHPKGHSWGDQSCKNVDTGSNKKYLPHEIAHGTVLVRVHDHTGQEIYRASLQPHHNDAGDTAYAMDAEYGVKHPSFTAHAHDVANRLSGEYKGGLYTKHPKVYSNNKVKKIFHPQDTTYSKPLDERIADATNPKATQEYLFKSLDDPHEDVRQAALTNKNINEKHITKALKDQDTFVVMNALSHSKSTPEHTMIGLKHPDASVRSYAILSATHSNEDHLEKALKDRNSGVRIAALHHNKISKNHLKNALNDSNKSVRELAERKLNKMR